ncbi:hypothetical protein O6V14_18650 [Sphingomonas faeni]|uniref:hypothetical protein n=1 Tax=Sphingomonas faeni TaxID=185950 RepID=UPI003362ABB4
MEFEREFEFTIEQGGVPGVILPKKIPIRGALNAAALRSFRHHTKNLNDTAIEYFLKQAFKRRIELKGLDNPVVELKVSDILAPARARASENGADGK